MRRACLISYWYYCSTLRQFRTPYSMVRPFNVRQHKSCVLYILALSTANATTSTVSLKVDFISIPGATDNKFVSSNFTIIFLKSCGSLVVCVFLLLSDTFSKYVVHWYSIRIISNNKILREKHSLACLQTSSVRKNESSDYTDSLLFDKSNNV